MFKANHEQNLKVLQQEIQGILQYIQATKQKKQLSNGEVVTTFQNLKAAHQTAKNLFKLLSVGIQDVLNVTNEIQDAQFFIKEKNPQVVSQLEKAFSPNTNSTLQQQQPQPPTAKPTSAPTTVPTRPQVNPIATNQPKQQPQVKTPVVEADIFGSQPIASKQPQQQQQPATIKKSASKTSTDDLFGEETQTIPVSKPPKSVTPPAKSKLDDLFAPPSLDDMMLAANNNNDTTQSNQETETNNATKQDDTFGEFQTTQKSNSTGDMSQFDLLIGKSKDEPQEFLSFNEAENKSVKILSMFQNNDTSTAPSTTKLTSPALNKSPSAMDDFF